MKKSYTILNYIFLICIPLAIGAISIRFWEMDFSVYPDMNGGDGILGCALLKSIQENGLRGYFFNDTFGAPTGSTLIDVPFYDIIYLFLVYIIGLFTMNVPMTFYLSYIIPFAFISVAMYKLLKRFEIKWWIADAFSILTTCAPYHFYRGLGHITLSNYFTVPLGIYLMFSILDDEWNDSLSKKKSRITIVIFALLVGLGSLYYAFFAAMLMCVAMVVRLAKNKKNLVSIKNAIPILFVIIGFFINIIPKLVYGFVGGENPLAGIRYAWESEVYGLKIIQLLLPTSYTRIPFLAELTNKYTNTFQLITENYMSSLGIISSIGFIILCMVLIARVVGIERAKNVVSEQLAYCALAVLCMVLFCTIGGFGALFSFLVSPQIRALNRGSIYISCLCFLAIAMLVNELAKRRKKVGIVIGVVLLFVGALDQVRIAPPGWQSERKEKQNEYLDFFKTIEESVQENAIIYQVPFMDFPEYGFYKNIHDYAPFTGYLLTDNLKWSYGAVKGRDNLAKDIYFSDGKSDTFLGILHENGYSGVLIDTYGYEDMGEEIIELYSAVTKSEPLISDDGRYYFYQLSDFKVKRDVTLDQKVNWIYDSSTFMFSTECEIEAHSVYEICIEYECTEEPIDVWIDFYGGANYDNMEQQKSIRLSEMQNEKKFFLDSGNADEADFSPILFRMAVTTESECKVTSIKITKLSR